MNDGEFVGVLRRFVDVVETTERPTQLPVEAGGCAVHFCVQFSIKMMDFMSMS